MEFTKYNTSTKAINIVGSCPDELIGYQAQAGESIVIGTYLPEKYYIDGSLPRARSGYLLSVSKFTITADGVDTCVISNIPANTIISLNNYSSFNVDDGVFEITSSEVATLELVFINRHYLTSTVIINAV